MTHPVLALSTAPDLPLLLAAVVPAALALVLTAWAVRRRDTHPRKRLGSPAVKVASIAALGCTAYSADTSWRFAADYLDMAGTAERAGMFAAAELALFATALMARQNLATQGAPGLPGTLVWVITGVQVIPAYAESGPVGGTVRAFVGPVMAAMLWHLAMGIELRLRTPGAASHGLLAVLGREARERLLSRLGIAARDRDAAQITRDRATARAVALAARLAECTPEQQRSWHGRRLTRRLSKAVGRASVGTDLRQRAQLLDQLAARRDALALATVPLPSPWSLAPGTTTAGSVPSPPMSNAPVPVPGPHGPDEPDAGRGPDGPRGPVPEIADSTASSCEGTEGKKVGIVAPEAGAVPGTGPADPEAGEGDAAGAGTDRAAREAPGQGPGSYRGPSAVESGTETTGDRGPTDTDTGTETTGDRGRTVPLRRKTTTKPRTKNKGKRGRSRTPRTQRPPREPEQSVDQLVQQLRPHVPALLERDGNEAVTRVQLREILRREGLKGGRNERLSLVLQELRSDDTTKTRSTVR
ncbi:membrane protein [Streptomyces hebeiensis]|uniref:Membrane protein n=1 Tax=Streptomyces hebeiensis TaxID=229486 RepID=A0ABN1UMY6_9ACTN